MAVTRGILESMREDVRQALEPVAAKWGLTLTVQGGTYDAEMYRPRVEFSSSNRARAEFDRVARYYGLSPAHYGARVVVDGRPFTIEGIKLRARTKPVLIRSTETGKTFVCSVSAVQRSLGIGG